MEESNVSAVVSHEVESSGGIQSSKRSLKCKNKNCQSDEGLACENGYYYCENCGRSEDCKDEIELVSEFNYNSSFVPIAKSNAKLTVGVSKAIYRCHKRTISNIAPGQRQAQDKIKLIAQNYDATKEMVEIAIKVFDDIYQDIKTKSIELKKNVASCCLYKVLENNCIPLVLRDFISNNHLKRKLFYKALKLVNPKFTNASRHDDLIRGILGKGEVKAEEFDDLIKRCEEILNLAERCWLLSGRSPIPLVVACSYFAYRLHLIDYGDVHWSRVDFKEFCRRFQIEKNNTANKRKNELKSLFLTLAQNPSNPMYDGSELSERDIETHLKYILMFSEGIIKNFLASKSNSSMEVSEKEESIILESFRKNHNFSSDTKREDGSELTDEQAASLNKLPDEDLINEEEMKQYIKSAEAVAEDQEVRSKIMEDSSDIKKLECMLFQGHPKYN